MSNDTIAKTILAQLGGPGRLKAMIGAHSFSAERSGVSFKIKARGTKANHIKITLNAMDTYDIVFSKIGRLVVGPMVQEVAKLTDIYNDQLIEVCERHTGLSFRL